MSIASRPDITLSVGFDRETRIEHRLGVEGAVFSFPGGFVELIFDEGALERMIAQGVEALAVMRDHTAD
ncbi:hypothetical protein [Saccharothrix australiensis]|uniref:Uncharacterized protein n=1 Tax=Saccharothrix australiensis TaxID=2072 RepID=A0A495VU44_9PSEU|nr:hypothetical protein [Saccharothrix australiensis]RKT52227.1 hypothetical protein C8E97_0734 [Saccharothrix australiensis]